MRIHHLNCGTFRPLGQLFVNGHGSPFASGELVCHCLVVETSAGVVLVDTGLGTGDIADPLDSLPGPIWQSVVRAELDIDETMIRQLERMGIGADEVRNIVLTHLDFDHAGGLPDFPNATVHVMREEYEAAMRPEKWTEHERYSWRQRNHQPIWRLHEADQVEKWMDFDAIRPLPGLEPDILMIPLPGHTRGHCGVAVKDGPRWLLHAGDAFFHHAELNPEKRECPFGLRMYQRLFADDHRRRQHSLERLREFSQAHGDEVRVICSHDPDQLIVERAVQTSRAYLI